MRADELDRLFSQMREAAGGPPEVYAAVLERALAACDADPVVAADYLDALELHSELAEAYDRLGQVEAALRHADVLAEQGYEWAPDPRCRRAEILTRHGQLAEAAAIWRQVERDTPDDVWLYNNAGLEYADVGEHELALEWLTRGLQLAIRTGDPERLVGQMRDLRAKTLAALRREPDRLQTVDPRTVPSPRAPRPTPAGRRALAERDERQQLPVAWAWLPAEEYPQLEEHWPDIADGPAVRGDDGAVRDHTTYCRRMERRMREARDAGMTTVRIAPLRWSEFRTWLEESREDGEPAELRARVCRRVVPRSGAGDPLAARPQRALLVRLGAQAQEVLPRPRRGPRAMKTTRLRVTLREVTSTARRVTDVPAAITLDELHQVLQLALGWTDSHLHQFRPGDAAYSIPSDDWDWDDAKPETDERGVRLSALPPRFAYLYDLGDGWTHDVEVLGHGSDTGCVDDEGTCPLEDCGGPYGYAELLARDPHGHEISFLLTPAGRALALMTSASARTIIAGSASV